jgi:hypothetical protein
LPTVFGHVIRIRSYWIRVGADPITDVLVRPGEDIQTQKHTEVKIPGEGGDRDYSDASKAKGCLGLLVNHQKIARGKERLLSRVFKGS